MKLFSFLIFVFLFSFCLADDAPYGSLDQNLLYKDDAFTIGDDVVLYMYVGSGTPTVNLLIHPSTTTNVNSSSFIERAVFFPKVDSFSQIGIPGTGQNFSGVDNVYIFLNMSGGIVSEHRYYKKNTTRGYYVGSFTAVVTLTHGLPTSIDWQDDNCNECLEDECVDGKDCAISYAEAQNCVDSTLCNVSVYLAWTGTDQKGNGLTSKSKTPAAFSRFSWFPVYKSASGIANSHVFG